ncbi:potassium transporter TrkG [Deinococcus rhizophilus]|uniref:potassium transporter TrkG n=1 Tax=Deinococcus rhizophilus TaxID=3049544 RepID=UPI002DD66F81|nr:potassium transporter TrkG [Deinococcus rhizophilus]
MLGPVVVVMGLFLWLPTQPGLPFVNRTFEAFSAFGMVGLSMNTTPRLNEAGQLIVIVFMYLGRTGPLTFAIVIG